MDTHEKCGGFVWAREPSWTSKKDVRNDKISERRLLSGGRAVGAQEQNKKRNQPSREKKEGGTWRGRNLLRRGNRSGQRGTHGK